MDLLPLQPQGPLILEALRLVEGASVVEASLAATPGAELKAVLAEISSQGLLLMLADGRSFSASGKLPYPPGTELTFRILPQADGSTQLQPLRADPPPPPALLAPLVQGEASGLLQRLSAAELPTELLPLKALLDRLPAAPQPRPSLGWPPSLTPLAEAVGLARPAPNALPPSPGDRATAPPEAGHPPESAPSSTRLITALIARGLAPEPARTLSLILRGEAPPEGALKSPSSPPEGVNEVPRRTSGGPASTPASDPEPDRTSLPPAARVDPPWPRATVDRALLRSFGLPDPLIEALQAAAPDTPGGEPRAPVPTGNPLEATLRLRQLLERLPGPLAQRVVALLTLLPPAGQGQLLPPQDPLAQLIRSLLPQLAPGSGSPAMASTPPDAPLPPSEPATWLRWLREVTSALSHPEASPAEAPFHRLQAREGTALFEVPLPWAPDPGTLELWAERDAPGPERAEVHRVLLALNLGRTGELRVALQSGPAGVQAQVMATPEVAARLGPLLREELGDPSPFPVLVRATAEVPPPPRALAGSGLQALG